MNYISVFLRSIHLYLLISLPQLLISFSLHTSSPPYLLTFPIPRLLNSFPPTSFPPTSLHYYILTSLHIYLVTSLPPYLSTSLPPYFQAHGWAPHCCLPLWSHSGLCRWESPSWPSVLYYRDPTNWSKKKLDRYACLNLEYGMVQNVKYPEWWTNFKFWNYFLELYGSESISQVWATIVEFLEDLPEEVRARILGWLYDDMWVTFYLKMYN